MSSNRTERLLNLVICLLATNRWLTKEQIRRAVPQYEDCGTPEAFDRMFERDKEDLRELGVPLATGSNSAWFEDDQGYRVDRDAYALPEVGFTAEELAVLGLASRVWQQASLAGPAARAMVKLRALGVATDDVSLVGVEPRVRASDPAFEPLYAAARDRAPVSFRYRKPEGDVAERRVEPWALTSRGGRWYLVGHDRARTATRAFRLSRIEGPVRRIGAAGTVTAPEGLDPGSLVTGQQGEADRRTARLRVRAGRGAALRLRASGATPGRGGWDVLELPVGDVGSLATQIAGFGPDVVVEEPTELRETVVRLLRGALAAHPAPRPVRRSATGTAQEEPAGAGSA
jgi:proteasome accessory factor B